MVDLKSPVDSVARRGAGSDQILVGVLDAVRDLGLCFPDDISLATCDDFSFYDHLSITTISRDTRKLGEVAARLLLEQLAGGPARRVVLPTFLPLTAVPLPRSDEPR